MKWIKANEETFKSEDWLHEKLVEKDCELKVSAFMFENGVRIKIYTGLFSNGEQVKSYKCNEKWLEQDKPFAECPLSWTGRTATQYHIFLRTELHDAKCFVPQYSTILNVPGGGMIDKIESYIKGRTESVEEIKRLKEKFQVVAAEFFAAGVRKAKSPKNAISLSDLLEHYFVKNNL